MNTLVFVYGTLKRGYPMGEWLNENAEYVGEGSIKGTIYDLGAFPGVKLEGDGLVHGEVFRVNRPEVISRMDQYEGVHTDEEGNQVGLYQPVKVTLHDDHRQVLMYEYLKSVGNRKPIANGVYGGC